MCWIDRHCKHKRHRRERGDRAGASIEDAGKDGITELE